MADNNYYLKSNKKITVKGGIIKSVLYLVQYDLKEKGILIIEQQDLNAPQVGDHIIPIEKQEVNGEFQLNWIMRIYVKNGKITKRLIFPSFI